MERDDELRDLSGYLAKLYMRVPYRIVSGRRKASDMTDSRLKQISLAEYLERLTGYPADEEQLSDQLWKRYFAWQDVLITLILVSLLTAFIIGAGNPALIAVIVFDLFLTGAGGVPVIVLGLRIFMAHFIGHKMFMPRRSSFKSEEKADQAIASYKKNGPSRVVTWICLPSNFEVILGLIVGTVAALTTPQFLAA